MSRFNTLYLGEPSDAADQLERDATCREPDPGWLRPALINALRRIATLENQVATLRKETSE